MVSTGTAIKRCLAGLLCHLFRTDRLGAAATGAIAAAPNQRFRAVVSPLARRKLSRDLSPDRSWIGRLNSRLAVLSWMLKFSTSFLAMTNESSGFSSSTKTRCSPATMIFPETVPNGMAKSAFCMRAVVCALRRLVVLTKSKILERSFLILSFSL